MGELKQEGYTVDRLIPVPMMTLDELFAQHAPSPHLLSLDVEGLDESILDDCDLTSHRPIIICVETLSVGTGKKNNVINQRLKVAGYHQVADTFVNSIFVREESWN